MTMQVGDDDASVTSELLSVVSGLGAELVERDVCREQLMDGVRHAVGYPERGDREPRTTYVADHRHDLAGRAFGVLLLPFGEEQAAAREPPGAVIQWEQRDGWAGGLVWSLGQVGQLARRCSASARSVCFEQSRRSQHATTWEQTRWLLEL
jgi:hypothetical protein